MAYGKISRKELIDIEELTQNIEDFAKTVEKLYAEHHDPKHRSTRNHGPYTFLDLCRNPREKAENLERYVETMLQHEDIGPVRGSLDVIKRAAQVIQEELSKGMMNDSQAFFVSKAHLEQEIRYIRTNVSIILDHIASLKHK